MASNASKPVGPPLSQPDPLRAAEERFLLAYLQGRDAECPLCGYNVRDLTSPRCPECGRELRLRVGLTEPFLAAWTLTLIALALVAGLGLFFVPIVVKDGWPHRFTPVRKMAALNFGLLSCMAAIPAVGMVALCRQRFMRLKSRTQWRLAAYTSLASAAAFVGILVGIWR